MTYDVTLVQFNGNVNGITTSNTAMGFPSDPFNYLLASTWCCLPTSGIHFSDFGYQFTPIIGTTSFGTTVQLTLKRFGINFFVANYDTSLLQNVRSNVLLSVDCVQQIVQLYVNDNPLTPTSGGFTSNSSFWLGPVLENSWSVVIGSGLGIVYPALADFYMTAPDSFFDLSITANRRKFINADLSPVYLGANGSLPTGSQPPVYLTVENGTPNDFITNYGTGGSFSISSGITLSFQTAGACNLPTPPSQAAWAITSSLDSEFPGAVGDVWATDTYIDFSDPNIRAEFENADGSWLWLGSFGQRPTGTSPLLFLTVQDGAQPSDILIGYGQNQTQSHWSLVLAGIDPTTGQPYPAMSFDVCGPTVINNLELTDIQVETTTILPVPLDDLITLRWSDDAGASWSNGLLKSLGAAGEYFTTPTWYRLGMARNRIIELSWSGARAEALQGCFVEVTIAAT